MRLYVTVPYHFYSIVLQQRTYHRLLGDGAPLETSRALARLLLGSMVNHHVASLDHGAMVNYHVASSSNFMCCVVMQLYYHGD